jgi:HSP20 family molecular chaperone IbpA
MTTLKLSNLMFDNFFTNWDRAFFEGDHSYWRRNNTVKGRELEDSYEYSVPLAGFKKENIKATVHEGEVYIVAKQDDSTASYSFLIPEGGDASSMSAKHKDGLLTVKIKKKESEKKIELTID